MRRLTVVQLLPALESGGVERSTLEIGEALVRAGHRSIAVSAGGRLCAALQAQGSEHLALDIGRKSLATLRHIRGLRRLFQQWRPDIVHARSRLPAWLALRALQGLPGPRPHFVTSVHGLNSPGWYSSILTRGERVICVSETVRRHVLAQWPATDPARLVVIEPGIDPAAFPGDRMPDADWWRQWRETLPALAGRPLLLLPGRGTRLKGHATAISLLAALKDAGCDAGLCLLGAREPGRERYLAELESLAGALGVADRLAITAPRADIATVYAASAMVLQLSERPEAFGRTALEALATGRPVLGWAQGGVGETLARHFPAGAITPGDLVALAQRAEQWLREPPQVSATLDHTLARMQAQTLELYEALVAA